MRVLVTGARGFIAKNLIQHLEEMEGVDVLAFTRADQTSDLEKLLDAVDWVFHLAGVNRPQDPKEFESGNKELTEHLCNALKRTNKKIPIVYSSSIQAEKENEYGLSKLAAEEALLEFNRETGTPIYIYRLPNVFGKWCRPSYNSVVATFCYNISHGIPIQINDPTAPMRLVYVDDVVEEFIGLFEQDYESHGLYKEVAPEYQITVGDLADLIGRFKNSRESLISERVGSGLVRAIYSTYVSYLSPEDFAYPVQQYGDPRGVFVEMLKTQDSGQFSFFTAHPGVTRGGHYHHSKTEKFLVIKGTACFRFRHVVSGEYHELHTSGETPQVVETVPGWTHDVTNTGDEELICMLWANEIFDRERPDTYTCALVDEKDVTEEVL
ncbi:MAG: NAD-dependent epimerase/dehydratase family protein [Pseudomonadales bacterium]|nr:NAD-dependent epimerase/dehydratase family protein [Pseudomonadales bacterium]